MCLTLADSMALTGLRQRRLQKWKRTIQRCVQFLRPLRHGLLDLALIVEEGRLRRSRLPPTPKQRSQKAALAPGATGDDLDSAIPRRGDLSETDRPHSNLEARREVRSHPRREAGNRLPSVKTILKRTRAEIQGPAHRKDLSCLWQEEMNLTKSHLMVSMSPTGRAPSTTGTLMTTSGTLRTTS